MTQEASPIAASPQGGLVVRIPAPRLLPTTIAFIAALLTVKTGILMHAAITHSPATDTIIVAAANAASTEVSKESGHTAPKKHGAAEEPKPAAEAPPPAQAVPDGPPPVSDSEKALLQELRQRRKELDSRAETIATREAVLTATEQKLAERVAELQTLQKKLESLDTAQKQKQDAGWQGMVKLYEAMKPKDAATIFNDLSMPVLLPLLDRMKEAKAAAVMAAMNPDKARDVTAELAQMRTGRGTGQAMPDKNAVGG